VLGAYDLIQFQQQNYALTSEIEEAESFAPLIVFRAIAIGTTIIISILIGLLSFQLATFVVKPLETLTKSVVNFSKGDYSVRFKSSGHVQEIQELSNAFGAMAEAVSADIQYREKTQQLIEASAKELKEANQHIEDSIKVSRGIQKSHLPTQSVLDELFQQSYFLWQPKDIVGGDFFWVEKYGSRTYALCGDCTGHGVPGAFMTLLAYSALTHISEETYRTAPLDVIIQELHQRFSKSLGLNKQDAAINTGFEASMLCFDEHTQKVYFAGAGQHLIIKNASDQSVQFVKGNKHPIGYKTSETAVIPVEVHSFDLQDQLFVLYSDGWTTQVGEEAKRMMGNKTLLKTIEASGSNRPQQLGQYLEMFFKEWTGTEARRDDLSLIIMQGLKSLDPMSIVKKVG
jgi:serine phosphatase RsbU (regulator of sigma subunit)